MLAFCGLLGSGTRNVTQGLLLGIVVFGKYDFIVMHSTCVQSKMYAIYVSKKNRNKQKSVTTSPRWWSLLREQDGTKGTSVRPRG